MAGLNLNGWELPRTLEDWPDVIDRPERLMISGSCGDCIAMHIVRELGGKESAIRRARYAPCPTLRDLGVPIELAHTVVHMNDSQVRETSKPFDYLMRELGYAITEVDTQP